MSNTKEKNFVAWEYIDVDVKRNNAPLYMDCYQNFGWIFIEQCATHYTPDVPTHNASMSTDVATHGVRHDQEMVKLKFKRDSKLPNKIQVEQLQHRCEGALSSIQRLENTKSARFIGSTIGFGIVGALSMGVSIFNFINGNIPLCVFFAVTSLVGWAAAYCFFAKVNPKKNEQINPQIKEQFEVVYQTCEQANSLLV